MWQAAANSWNGWSPGGVAKCPECSCERLYRKEGWLHEMKKPHLEWDFRPEDKLDWEGEGKGICKHEEGKPS
jgi:hypothetical protein